MASLSIPHFFSLPSWNSKAPLTGAIQFMLVRDHKLQSRWVLSARPKKEIAASVGDDEATNELKGAKKTRATSRGRKKKTPESEDDSSEPLASVSMSEQEGLENEVLLDDPEKPKRKTRKKKTPESEDGSSEPSPSVSMSEEEGFEHEVLLDDSEKPKRKYRKKKTPESEDDSSEPLASVSMSEQEGFEHEPLLDDSEKPKRKYQKKAVPTSTYSSGIDEGKTGNKPKRGRKSKDEVNKVDEQLSESETSDTEGVAYLPSEESEDESIDLKLEKSGDDDDISSTYSWPPLVCCFGAAQHAFIPSGRPSNRLIDYEIHDSLKDALWGSEKFIRSPGGSAGSVAIALASLGGRVAFMGKLGDDIYGQAMLYYLNVNNIQTRSVRVDDKRPTAVSQMKITKRGVLRAITVKQCAEDCLFKSEINIDVLKEAKTFYLNTSALLDENMRRTTLQALKISKKLGGMVFYDLNLPLPLWKSCEETKAFIQQVWNLADVIEVTKQELEFLCGITPEEEFDTKNNKRSKFVHYEPDVIAPMWHENLKVLFVTNGTSKIHYYTKEHNASVHGMEDAPITPFTQDMSASGDGIVAALLRMLTVQPHLITDKGYLERTVKYAINCGVIDQWIVGRQRGFPPKEDFEYEEEPEADLNGIKSLTEREFRTVAPIAS